jgi:hypothetical protein
MIHRYHTSRPAGARRKGVSATIPMARLKPSTVGADDLIADGLGLSRAREGEDG